MILQLCLFTCFFLSKNLIEGKPLIFRMKRSSENDHAAKIIDDRSSSRFNTFLVPNWLPFHRTFLYNLVDDRMLPEFKEPISEINSFESQEIKSDDNLDSLAGRSELNIDNTDNTEIDLTDAETPSINVFQNAQNDEIDFSESRLNDMAIDRDISHEEDSNTGIVLESEQLLEPGENEVNDDGLKQLFGLPWLMIRGLTESAESMGGLEIDISDDKNNEINEVLSEGDTLANFQTAGDDTDLPVNWNGEDIVTFDDIHEMLAEESTNSVEDVDTLSRIENDDLSENGPNTEWFDSEGIDSTVEIGGMEFSAADNSELDINNRESSDDFNSDDFNSDTPINENVVLEGNLEIPNVDDVTEVQGSDDVTFTTGEEISVEDNLTVEPGTESSLESSPLNDDSNFEPISTSDDSNFDIPVTAGDTNFEAAKVNDENKGSLQINDIATIVSQSNGVSVSTDELFNDEPVT